MYLTLLDEAQQVLFFRAARHLAEVDGLDPREETLLEQAQLEHGINQSQIGPRQELGVIVGELDKLTHAAARNAFLLELAGVVVADQSVTDPEVQALTEIARALGADENHLTASIALATRWRDLAAETTMFLGEE